MLLQIEGNDVFSDFLGQIPPAIFIFVCGAGLLLFGAFAWFVYFKPQRQKRLMSAEQPPISTLSSSPLPADNPKAQTGDLPDLDDLLGRVKSSAPSAPAPPTLTDSWVTLASGGKINAEVVLTVLRDPRDDRLMVRLDDTAYRSLSDTPEVKERFVKVMRELSDIVMKPDDNPPPLADEDDIAALLDDAPAKPTREFAPPPPISADGAMPGDLPSYRIDDNVSVSGGKYVNKATPELNIAQAIDSYLQHKLRYTPEMQGRSMQIQPAPRGGVRIRVDNQFYEAVDEIPDADTRAFIQSAIQEWQSRQK